MIEGMYILLRITYQIEPLSNSEKITITNIKYVSVFNARKLRTNIILATMAHVQDISIALLFLQSSSLAYFFWYQLHLYEQ